MSDETTTVGGHDIAISNRDKVLFPESGLTKGDLIDYYARIAPTMLPHVRNRPLSMRRFPDGIGKGGFFQKDTPDYFPDWVETAALKKEGGTVRHVLANDAATLVYLANQGCIEPHVGLSRVDRVDFPDRLIFDLDPSDGDFDKVRDAARAVRACTDELELVGFVMTTGSRGLHVVFPLDRSADFDTVRDFAHRLAANVAALHPDVLTVEQRKDKRGDRVFLDYLRNGYAQTAIPPYGVRAKEGAPVATPLDWSEVGDGKLTPHKYTIKSLFRRLAQRDDPWKDIDRSAQSIDGANDALAQRERKAQR